MAPQSKSEGLCLSNVLLPNVLLLITTSKSGLSKKHKEFSNVLQFYIYRFCTVETSEPSVLILYYCLTGSLTLLKWHPAFQNFQQQLS